MTVRVRAQGRGFVGSMPVEDIIPALSGVPSGDESESRP